MPPELAALIDKPVLLVALPELGMPPTLMAYIRVAWFCLSAVA